MIARSALPSAALLALAAFLAPSQADAFERQWHAGAAFGYALLADGNSYGGLGGSLHLTYGLTDAFNVLVQFDTATHPSGDLIFLGAGAGATYVLDILQWVPYAGLMVGPYDVAVVGLCGSPGEQSCHNAKFGASVPFGVDYAFSRGFAAGFAGKYTLLLPGAGDGPGSYFTAYAHAEFRWGY